MWFALISLLAGTALPLAFAPFNFFTLSYVAPAILLWIWLRSTAWQAAYRGLFFGLGFFGVGTSWVYISVHNFGNAPAALAILITFLMILVLALYIALQGFFSRLLFRHKSVAIQSLCVFPAMWVIFEGLRAWLFTGFPWLSLGYSQLNTPLHAFAPIFGIYGVSLAVCWISGALVLLATPLRNSVIKLVAVIIIVIFLGSGLLLKGKHWTEPTDQAIKVSLVQGNIAQKMKWQPQELINILKIYKDMTSTLWQSKLIIWPEAAVPILPHDIKAYYDSMSHAAIQHGDYLIIGSPLYNPLTKQFYNGLRMIGAGTGVYYKRHLVPFGEYTPLPSVFGALMKKLDIPMSDFSKGPAKQIPLRIGKINIAAFICYEIAFSREVLRYATHSQLLINISDDSWFGHSIALDQQVQMAQFRALETGRPLLSSTNTGVTAVINPLGKIVKSLPIDKRQSLTAIVMPMTGNTPLMFWNYYPVIGVIILLLLISGLKGKNDD